MTTEDKSNFVGTNMEKQTNMAQDPPPITSQFSATNPAMYTMQQNPTTFYQNTNFVGTDMEKQTNTAQNPSPIMTPSQFSATQSAMYAMQQNPTTSYPNTPYSAQQLIVVLPEAEPDNTPPPNTTNSLILSIVAFLFCGAGWMCAIAALYFNQRASSQKQMGQYAIARKTLVKANVLIAVSVITGIISWIIFGIYFKEFFKFFFSFPFEKNQS